MGKLIVLKILEGENDISLVEQLQRLGTWAGFQERALNVQTFISKDLTVWNADLV